jgi:hypothetical protein
MSAGRRPKNRSGKQGAASRERLLQGLHSRRQNAHTGARRFSCLGSGRARSQPLMTRSSSAAPSVVRFYRAPPDTFRPNYAPDHWSCQCPRPLNVTVNVTLDVLPGQAYTRGRPTVQKGVHVICRRTQKRKSHSEPNLFRQCLVAQATGRSARAQEGRRALSIAGSGPVSLRPVTNRPIKLGVYFQPEDPIGRPRTNSRRPDLLRRDLWIRKSPIPKNPTGAGS